MASDACDISLFLLNLYIYIYIEPTKVQSYSITAKGAEFMWGDQNATGGSTHTSTVLLSIVLNNIIRVFLNMYLMCIYQLLTSMTSPHTAYNYYNNKEFCFG